MKKLKINKNRSFNIITSREKESSARKVKITMGCSKDNNGMYVENPLK